MAASDYSFKWDASTDTGGSGLKDYRVYKNGTLQGETTGLSWVAGVGAIPTGCWSVTARDNALNESGALACITYADTTAPTFLQHVYQSGIADTSIDLAWSVVDNIAVTEQTLYWRIGAASYNTITLGLGQTYTKTGLSPGTGYSFYVRASDAAGNATNSAALSVSTSGPPPDTTPPSQVTGLFVGAPLDYTIGVQWDAASDNVGVYQYEIWESGDGVNNWVLIGTVNHPTVSLQQGGYTGGEAVFIKVRATDLAGNYGAFSTTENIIITGDMA